jgi:hypothetical protein
MQDNRFHSTRWRAKGRSPGPGSTTSPTCAPRSNDSAPGEIQDPPSTVFPTGNAHPMLRSGSRLEVVTERNRQLEAENRHLREALAVALGEQRATSIVGQVRDTPKKKSQPIIGPC